MAPANKIEDIFNVKGLVAVVTGGGSGLGLYAARALDANGARVVYIVGRREETLNNAAKTGINGTIKPIVGDVTDKESLAMVTEQIRKEQGYVNLVFANAGISGPSQFGLLQKENGEKPSVKELQEKLLGTSVDDFSFTQHVNISGTFFTAIAFMDLLDAGNKQRNVPQDSQILVTSSIAGFSRQLAHSFAYSASKAGVTHLTKMLSTSFAQHGFHIRVNAIAPGLYPSEMTTGQTSKMEKFSGIEGHAGAFADAHKMPADKSPAERTGSEEDIAGTILFMASKAGAYLNGETMVTDGGRMAQMPSVY